MKIISADDHLAETPDLWEKRLPKGLREKGPRFVKLPGGGEGWMMPGAPAPRPLGLDVMAGRQYEDYQAVGIRWQDVRPGCYDPSARLRDMDEGESGQPFSIRMSVSASVAAVAFRVIGKWRSLACVHTTIISPSFARRI